MLTEFSIQDVLLIHSWIPIEYCMLELLLCVESFQNYPNTLYRVPCSLRKGQTAASIFFKHSNNINHTFGVYKCLCLHQCLTF